MTETSPDSETDINLFLLNYRNLVSSLENQRSNVDIPIKNYHKFLTEQEISFNFGEEINHIRSELSVKWETSEINQFFTALQRCGKHNPVEISRRIKTKTPLQVIMYIEKLENELQYAKEIGRIKDEPLNYEYIPAAREMSEKWTKFENKSAKVLIQKLEENEIKCGIGIDSTTNESKSRDKSKIELFKFDMGTKNKEPPNHILCLLYDVLRGWLTIIIHDLIIINQHHKRLYPQENVKHLITVQEIRRVLRFRGYKMKGDFRQHILSNGQAYINPKDQSNNNEVPERNISNIFLRNLINKRNDWSTDTDDVEVEEAGKVSGNSENESMKIKDTQDSDSSNCESSDVEEFEYVKWKEQFEQDRELELKENTMDKLYEKALVKFLSEQSTDNQFLKLRDDKLESIFYHATIWNDCVNHIKLDKALEDEDDD
ncbi:hypothetical protein RclHR1_10350010 [Rhizophagus clarus]|uniref:RNA polymerase I upstream activation factor complex subunit Rrn5 n=1 Tax=Rhizophagus clarus TaxID=94130 RepID=A0A2Z6QFJ9_9GLOM|nr:hypothetical protein RclHR1_10350010 [Rhizophagus clarus]GES78042.1 RNA polymerase I upstream activation factor complex subunit Rrn5 [Rhizophagus clarus]